MIIHSFYFVGGGSLMNLSSRLAGIAEQLPNKEAYWFEGESCTYGELNAAISKFSSGLYNMGIRQGDHIALLVGNYPYFVIGLYGALRLGATVIPINPIYTADEISYILMNGDVKAVIALDLLVPALVQMQGRLPLLEHVIICETPQGKEKGILLPEKMKSFANVLQSGDMNFQGPELADDDTAVILYTSGTTGKPKGAMLTHKNLYSNAQDVADYLQINEHDRVIATLPMFHVFCLTVALNAPLMNGGTVLIVPKFSPAKIFTIAREQKATIFAGVPTMYNFLYQYEGGSADDFRTLRLFVFPAALRCQWRY
jgi:long-chain acyl-CoA synthetase